MEKNYQEDQNYKAAQKRVKDIKGFYLHLIVYLFINIAIIVANSKFSDLEFSTFYTPLFWGVGLAAHWASVFGPGIFLGRQWEEKKIQELMEKDRKKMEKWK